MEFLLHALHHEIRKDTREVIDIARLNAEVKQTVERIDALRADIDAIIKELEDE